MHSLNPCLHQVHRTRASGQVTGGKLPYPSPIMPLMMLKKLHMYCTATALSMMLRSHA